MNALSFANPYFAVLLVLLAGEFLLSAWVNHLNARSFAAEVPREYAPYYDPAKYKQARDYHAVGNRFGLLRDSISLAALLIFLVSGGFNEVDRFARSFGYGEIGSGLIFVGALSCLKFLLQLPFQLYNTFVIEERFGFNRTTPKTFVADLVKGTILGVLLGAPIFAFIIYFFDQMGPLAWLYAWSIMTVFSLVLSFVAPVLILPLFNQFKPLPAGPVRDAIESYAKQQDFALQGMYLMDSSKRSTKSNAFFTGFGRYRRLVLFDTLLSKHSTDEIVAVVAHEVGHFKRKHIPQFMAISILTTGLTFFIFSRFLKNPDLFAAFRMENVSTYASFVFIAILYSPIARMISYFPNRLSRKFEFEADDFSNETYHQPASLQSALLRLSADNLSHPTPHPLKVALDYTHPPVLARIRAMNAVAGTSA